MTKPENFALISRRLADPQLVSYRECQAAPKDPYQSALPQIVGHAKKT